MKTLSEFANGLSDAQRTRSLAAKELADRTGLSALSVRQILAGKTSPRLTNAMALAQELGMELVLLPKEAAESLAQAIAPQSRARRLLTDLELQLTNSGHSAKRDTP